MLIFFSKEIFEFQNSFTTQINIFQKTRSEGSSEYISILNEKIEIVKISPKAE